MNNLRNALVETLEAMAEKARSMNMQGVGVASLPILLLSTRWKKCSLRPTN